VSKWSAKDPSDVADYWVSWQDFLPTDETITTATVTLPAAQPVAAPPFAELSSVVADFDDKQQRVRFAGGIPDTTYAIDFLIHTSAGETFEVTKSLQVKERTK
jgi:hypothetical protein